MEQKPLVSVVVLAYNSARFIRDTLESVLAQEYGPIELIVADDASSDDTVSIVEGWLSAHGSRFVSARLVRNRVNLGISGSCNNALRYLTGAWLKLIAADDVLLPGCIGDHVDNALLHPGTAVFFSRMETMDEQGRVTGEYFYPEAFFGYPVGRQIQCLLHQNCLPAPSAFIRMTDLKDAGSFDEAYPLLEDLPLWIKMLRQNRRFGGLNKLTVRYRVHHSLVYPVIGKRNERYRQAIDDFNRTVRVPLARRLSPLLYATVKIDLAVDAVVQRPWLCRAVLPLLWIWAKCSPYRVKSHINYRKMN